HLRGVIVRTPLLPCPWAGGHGLWLKPENLQPVGAFKLRGAYHALACLDPSDRANGVVTHSSGNHGRALAYAAKAFGVPAVIVMPDTAPVVKIAAVEALGAEVMLVPPAERESGMSAVVAGRGMVPIPPFDHRDVIAGQGTIGVEIIEDMPDVEIVLVPVGGGGLASGVATAVKALRPEVTVIGVEPELAADARESLHAGELRRWPIEETYRTMADGVRTAPSELTFAHLKARLDDIVTVSEDEIGRAVGWLAREAHLVVEPSGALGPAAYLGADAAFGRTVAVVTGGNIDPALFAKLVAPRPE
ncbi:MAG TPA: threonine/serine dehydratase, partial [Micromonosporaceae bacterium]